MKKDALKSHLSLVFLCIAGNTLAIAPHVQSKHMALIAELTAKIGPERTGEFIRRLEQKHSRKDVVSTPKPTIPQPPIQQAPVAPPVTIQPPMAPPVAQKTWMTDTEKENFHAIVHQLQLYLSKVHECLNDFFNRNNSEPYRTHVNCFKTQLKFLQIQLQNYPDAQTPIGTLLFSTMKKIAVSLERCQDLMCQTLDRDYTKMSLGATQLGINMKQIESPVNQQRAIINQHIGALRNELRKAQATELLSNINTLNTMIANTFDYGKDKNFQELLNTLIHRVKR